MLSPSSAALSSCMIAIVAQYAALPYKDVGLISWSRGSDAQCQRIGSYVSTHPYISDFPLLLSARDDQKMHVYLLSAF